MHKSSGIFRVQALLLAAWTILVFAGCSSGGGGAALTAPAAPTALTATAASSAGIDLAWIDNASNETGFTIERSADNVTFAEVATVAADMASYSDTGLAASTIYYYRVAATNAAGASDYSAVASATTQAPAVTAPAAPTGLSATAMSPAEINLAWTDNSDNETGFKIERSEDNANFTLITTTAANAVVYSDSGLTRGTTYYYRLAATNSAGDSAYATTANATTRLVQYTTFQPASVAIGQVSFNAGQANQGGAVGGNTLGPDPYGDPVVVNGRLYVPDSGNNRVLGFNAVPISNNTSADFVLGQPDLVSSASGTAADRLSFPQSVKTYAGKLFAAEYGNDRILIWNTAPTTTQAPADIVVGQAAFGSDIQDCTATNFLSPESFTVVGGKLIAADSGHNRVLIWNSIPSSNGAPANVVLGQNGFNTCASNDDDQNGSDDGAPTARTLNYPTGVWSDGTRLVIADSNHRVLIWNSFPTSNFAAADVVLGQADFTHMQYNDDNQDGAADASPTARTLRDPYFLDSNGEQLFVTDFSNNRVLIWNSFPASNFAAADVVLGQADFTHMQYNDDNQDGVADVNPTSRTLSNPTGLYVYGTKLFVADRRNSRFLIYESQ